MVTAAFVGADIEVNHVHMEDENYARLSEESPTGSLPMLVCSYGKVSQANAIANFIGNNHNPDFFGKDSYEKVQVAQWTDFASFELFRNTHSVVYPLFGKFNDNFKDMASTLTNMKPD